MARHDITEILLKVALNTNKKYEPPTELIGVTNTVTCTSKINGQDEIPNADVTDINVKKPESVNQMTDNTMARHDITEILLKVALNTNKQTNQKKKDKQRSTKHYTQKPKIE
jgi:hypothetical protein